MFSCGCICLINHNLSCLILFWIHEYGIPSTATVLSEKCTYFFQWGEGEEGGKAAFALLPIICQPKLTLQLPMQDCQGWRTPKDVIMVANCPPRSERLQNAENGCRLFAICLSWQNRRPLVCRKFDQWRISWLVFRAEVNGPFGRKEMSGKKRKLFWNIPLIGRKDTRKTKVLKFDAFDREEDDTLSSRDDTATRS